MIGLHTIVFVCSCVYRVISHHHSRNDLWCKEPQSSGAGFGELTREQQLNEDYCRQHLLQSRDGARRQFICLKFSVVTNQLKCQQFQGFRLKHRGCGSPHPVVSSLGAAHVQSLPDHQQQHIEPTYTAFLHQVAQQLLHSWLQLTDVIYRQPGSWKQQRFTSRLRFRDAERQKLTRVSF